MCASFDLLDDLGGANYGEFIQIISLQNILNDVTFHFIDNYLHSWKDDTTSLSSCWLRSFQPTNTYRANRVLSSFIVVSVKGLVRIKTSFIDSVQRTACLILQIRIKHSIIKPNHEPIKFTSCQIGIKMPLLKSYSIFLIQGSIFKALSTGFYYDLLLLSTPIARSIL